MIQRFLFLSLLCLFLVPQDLQACDACGININQTSSNLLLGHRNHILLISYQQSGFTTSSDHGHYSKDDFVTVDVMLKFRLTDRWFASVSQDYKKNERINDYRELSVLEGIGDTRVSAGYRWIDKENKEKRSFVSFETSLGVTLPFGQHDENIGDRNLPENFNLGTGSIGYFAQSSYFQSKNNFGFSIFTSFFTYNESPGGYKLGNKSVSAINTQYDINIGGLVLVPNAGLHFELITRDKFPNGDKVEESSGKGLHGKLGLATLVNGLQLGAKLQFPISQKYINNDVLSHNRVFLDLTYFF